MTPQTACNLWSAKRLNTFAEGWNLPAELKAKDYGAKKESIFASDDLSTDETLKAYYTVEKCLFRLFKGKSYHAVSAFLLELHGRDRHPHELGGPLWDEHRASIGYSPVLAIKELYKEIKKVLASEQNIACNLAKNVVSSMVTEV